MHNIFLDFFYYASFFFFWLEIGNISFSHWWDPITTFLYITRSYSISPLLDYQWSIDYYLGFYLATDCMAFSDLFIMSLPTQCSVILNHVYCIKNVIDNVAYICTQLMYCLSTTINWTNLSLIFLPTIPSYLDCYTNLNCLFWFLHEKECSFCTHLFCCTEMRWLFICSTAIWVAGSDTSTVASRARTDLTSSKCGWTRIWAI